MTSLGVRPSVGGLEVRYWRPLMFRWMARSISARTRDAIELSAVSAEAAALLIASPPVLTVAVSCAAGVVCDSMPRRELHPHPPAEPGWPRSKSDALRCWKAAHPAKSRRLAWEDSAPRSTGPSLRPFSSACLGTIQ